MAKKKKPPSKDGTKLAVQNRRARFDYFIDEKFEAGIMLVGTEVKSLRGGLGSLLEAWVRIDAKDEVWLMQCHIPEYTYGGYTNHKPTRERKLLLNKSEIIKIRRAVAEQGVTLVPTRIYFKHGRAKLEFGIGRGKKNYDKRADLKEKQAKRDVDRALKNRG